MVIGYAQNLCPVVLKIVVFFLVCSLKTETPISVCLELLISRKNIGADTFCFKLIITNYAYS